LLAIKSGQKSLAGRNSTMLEDVITFGVYLVKNTLLSRSPCRVSEAHRGKRPAGLGSFVIATMEIVWRLHAPHASPQTGGPLAQPVAAFE
jgi:hypothetical protein